LLFSSIRKLFASSTVIFALSRAATFRDAINLAEAGKTLVEIAENKRAVNERRGCPDF